MKLLLEKHYAEAMVSQFNELNFLLEHLKLGNRAEIPFHRFNIEQMGFLRKLYDEAGPAMRGHSAQIATLQHALSSSSERFNKGELEQLVPAITHHLTDNAIRGWLFKANSTSKPLAYLVTRIDYTPPGEEESGRILIELKTNSLGKLSTTAITILEKDIDGTSIAEIFASKGYLRETPELISNYDKTTECYFQWRSEYGKQFKARGTGVFAENPEASHRNQDWTRKSLVVLSSSGDWARLVNDEEIIQSRELTLDAPGAILDKYLRKAGRSMNYDSGVERDTENIQKEIPKGMFTQIPVHGYMLMFHMELHHHVWVHVDDMRVYEYQPELKDKLVLPPEQTDLIDILTAEMDVLMEDVVEGKSGGTTVLCAGPPGVGKTLTAEVYSEIIRRPLYRVHSGQLGLNVTEMEKSLKDTLTRAQRWGAVMLIDEADVYIKRRDDNIAANAVVGVFLRVLEYFNGLLFLTTNRVDDIDEAIVSRCIALIKFQPPEIHDRIRIWKVMTEQFKLEVSDTQIKTLANVFPKACGRDIKGLAKLVAKYCQYKNTKPTMKVFERCCIFRGMETQAPTRHQ